MNTLLAGRPALIVAALETGCRVGELLSLQWRDVRELDNVLLLPAKKTKDGEPRHVPMTSRLRATLDMRRLDPAGQPFGPDDYVFGNELGKRVGSFKKAWQTLVLKAHGSGNDAHDAPAGEEEIRATSLPLHKRCTNGSIRDSARR